MTLNLDQTHRDSILADAFKEYDSVFVGSTSHSSFLYLGGARHFRGLTTDALAELLKHNFIELTEAQNDSPTVEEFSELMQRWPELTAHGYAVTNERDDYRVTIEGLECMNPITCSAHLFKMEMQGLIAMRRPDEHELTKDYFRVWWD